MTESSAQGERHPNRGRRLNSDEEPSFRKTQTSIEAANVRPDGIQISHTPSMSCQPYFVKGIRQAWTTRVFGLKNTSMSLGWTMTMTMNDPMTMNH